VRVNINAQGRQVEIEVDPTNVSLPDVVALAQAAWDHTAGPEPSAAAYGFQSEKRWVDDKAPTGAGMWRPMGDVDA
jgi:hypothetical protein